jgi:hypothetical protein
MDDGRHVRLDGDALTLDRLDHAYAMTVNRTQGATAHAGHVLGDGGGRELAYVALSRTTGPTYIHVVADNPYQAADDLRREWTSERRQRWILDTDDPAPNSTGWHPKLVPGTTDTIRVARLRAERDAIRAVAPWAHERLRALDTQLRLDAPRLPSAERHQGLGLG